MSRHTGFRCLETWVSYVLNQHTASSTSSQLPLEQQPHRREAVRLLRSWAGVPSSGAARPVSARLARWADRSMDSVLGTARS